MAQKKKAARKKGHTGEMAAGIGAGVLAAAAAAGAGYYFYGSRDASKHRRKAAKWADHMKKEVVKEAKVLRKLDQKAIALIVDRAAKSYEGMRNVKREDLMLAAHELKQNWKEIEKELKDAAGKSGKAVKKAAKTATRSSRRKVAKKSSPKKKVAKKSSKKSR